MNANQKVKSTYYTMEPNGFLFYKKINKLRILTAEHSPDLLYLQETNFTDQTYKTFRNYTSFT